MLDLVQSASQRRYVHSHIRIWLSISDGVIGIRVSGDREDHQIDETD